MSRSDILHAAAVVAFIMLAIFSFGPREDGFLYEMSADAGPSGYRFTLRGECVCELRSPAATSAQTLCPVAATVCQVDFADSTGRRRTDLGVQPLLLDYIYQFPEPGEVKRNGSLGEPGCDSVRPSEAQACDIQEASDRYRLANRVRVLSLVSGTPTPLLPPL
jgi:hypothetical protein